MLFLFLQVIELCRPLDSRLEHGTLSLSFPLSAIWDTCSVFLPLPASGKEGHLHHRQAQVSDLGNFR